MASPRAARAPRRGWTRSGVPAHAGVRSARPRPLAPSVVTRLQAVRHHLRRWTKRGDGGGAGHSRQRGRAGDLLRAGRQRRTVSRHRAARARRGTRCRYTWNDPRQADESLGRRDRAAGLRCHARPRAARGEAGERVPHAARIQIVRRVRSRAASRIDALGVEPRRVGYRPSRSGRPGSPRNAHGALRHGPAASRRPRRLEPQPEVQSMLTALPAIIRELKKRGFAFVRVGDA